MVEIYSANDRYSLEYYSGWGRDALTRTRERQAKRQPTNIVVGDGSSLVALARAYCSAKGRGVIIVLVHSPAIYPESAHFGQTTFADSMPSENDLGESESYRNR